MEIASPHDYEAHLRVYHGGRFVTDKKCKTEYVGGTMLMKICEGEICYFNLLHIVRQELNYNERAEMWFIRQGLSLFAGRKKITCDKDIEILMESRDKDGFIDLYVIEPPTPINTTKPTNVVHPSNSSQIDLFQPLNAIYPTPKAAPQVNKFRRPKLSTKEGKKQLSGNQNKEQAKQNEIPLPEKVVQSTKIQSSQKHPKSKKNPKSQKSTQSQKHPQVSDEVGSEFDEEDSESDLDVVISDDDLEDQEDDDLFVEYVDDDILDDVETCLAICSQFEREDEEDIPIEEDEDVLLSDEEDLVSELGSDDEDVVYPSFNDEVDFKKPIQLCLGLKFRNHKVFRKALRNHAIENGYDYYFLHNGVKRVSVYCEHRCGCEWVKKRGKLKSCTCNSESKCLFRVHGRKVDSDNTFQIRSLTLDHTCGWTDYNSKVSFEYLAERYLEEFRLQPDLKLDTFIRKVFRELGVEIGYYKAYYTKVKALKMIYGNDSEQYKRVWDYGEAIIKHNPGNSVFITLGNIDKPPPCFQRMYMCLQACKEGFVSGCRPMIGLDGCHLKGSYPGQLLCAVGKDGNFNIFPVAWAVVEVENKETWTWFLELLMNDIGSVANEGKLVKSKDDVAFISDRQKGLMEAFNTVVPNAEIRFCARHIWANFSKSFSGEDYKQQFWKAARAYTKGEFEMSMEGMKLLSKEAYTYLAAIPTKYWSRHAFSPKTKSGVLLNNSCESFNNVLRKCREKPILSMMEWIRRYTMKRMFTKREGVKKYGGLNMPTIKKQLQAVTKESRNCLIFQSHLMEFEIEYNGDTHKVNLDERTCGCFKWDLTGVPCVHAVAALTKKRIQPESFVHPAYSKEMYIKAYSPVVHALPGPKHWDKTTHAQPTPPPFRKMPGRPNTKKRKKALNEEATNKRVKKKKRVNMCSNCGLTGHYKSSCRNAGVSKKTNSKKSKKSSQVEEFIPSGSQPQASQVEPSAHALTTTSTSAVDN